jgi:hypothetical protein
MDGDDRDAGGAMSDCNDRQVVMMLVRAAEETVGGLAGGEKKLDCRAGREGCAESHENADGRSIVYRLCGDCCKSRAQEYDASGFVARWKWPKGPGCEA